MSNGKDVNVEVFENLKLELRRGCLTLAVLTQLRSERYGYTLRKALADDGLEIEAAMFGHLAATDDKREGTRAFLEKRPASFKGA